MTSRSSSVASSVSARLSTSRSRSARSISAVESPDWPLLSIASCSELSSIDGNSDVPSNPANCSSIVGFSAVMSSTGVSAVGISAVASSVDASMVGISVVTLISDSPLASSVPVWSASNRKSTASSSLPAPRSMTSSAPVSEPKSISSAPVPSSSSPNDRSTSLVAPATPAPANSS